MKTIAAALAGCTLALLACVHGAEAPVEKHPLLSATEIISQLDGIFDEDDENEVVVSPERFAVILNKKLLRMDRLASDFRARFPEHPLRWKVLMVEVLSLPVRAQAGLPMPAEKSADAMLDQILAAGDAPAELKSEASVHRLMLGAEKVGAKALALDEWERRLTKHWVDFSESPDNAELEELHLGMVEEFAPARLDVLVAELVTHKDPAIADMAKEKQSALKTMAELKSKPLDLKFKAMDGAEVDLAALRGKVVLVDFWATWCAPCMTALPKLTAAHAKFHGRGFEIVGISLDEDEDALKRVMKTHKVTWPQFFDGRGWESEIAHRYGVTALPTTWLVNREGMIVEVNPEVDLAAKIDGLLR